MRSDVSLKYRYKCSFVTDEGCSEALDSFRFFFERYTTLGGGGGGFKGPITDPIRYSVAVQRESPGI